jgi:hypothetical protein
MEHHATLIFGRFAKRDAGLSGRMCLHNDIDVPDDEAVDLPDLNAARTEVEPWHEAIALPATFVPVSNLCQPQSVCFGSKADTP